MKTIPILFSAPMIRALIIGSKTQTRRAINPQPDGKTGVRCPFGKPGDQLWVRETHMVNDIRGNKIPESERANCEILYRATDDKWLNQSEDTEGLRWAPSIHMPRWASRLTLKITGIRVERLNDISEEDAKAEGIEQELGGWNDYSNPSCQMCINPIDSYRTLWESINGEGSWAANPWVWVIEFEVLK